MNDIQIGNQITDEDLDWLDQFLLNRFDESDDTEDKDEGIIELSELDGYFTAIVSAPTLIPPSHWLPAIWGDFEPEWTSKADLDRALSIMMQIMNSIVYSLMEEPDEYAPLFPEVMIDGQQQIQVEEWCLGYLRGMGLNADDWNIEIEPMQSLLMPIVMFGSQALFEMQDTLEETQIEVLKQQIAPSVKQIHAYWLEQRENELYAADPTFNPETDELPEYSDGYLQGLNEAALIELLLEDEDRVPRNLIDECVSRGDKMIELLAPMAKPADDLELKSNGRWWIRLHALMILGLMNSERAGMAMLPFIDFIDQESDDALQEWFAGFWPALTRNKPETVLEKLREICKDSSKSWYTRLNVTEAIVDHALSQGEQELENELDWIVRIVEDQNEDWDFRLFVCSLLLDFPRERNKELLLKMASEQSGMETIFDKNDVDRAYVQQADKPEWGQSRDLWDFYQTEEIKARQQRRKKEAESEIETMFEDFDNPIDTPESYQGWTIHEPFIRETPKVGRNDPCPCGSGKKFKKCCLH